MNNVDMMKLFPEMRFAEEVRKAIYEAPCPVDFTLIDLTNKKIHYMRGITDSNILEKTIKAKHLKPKDIFKSLNYTEYVITCLSTALEKPKDDKEVKYYNVETLKALNKIHQYLFKLEGDIINDKETETN